MRKRAVVGAGASVVLPALFAVAAGPNELAADAIVAAQQSGVSADGIVTMVTNRAKG